MVFDSIEGVFNAFTKMKVLIIGDSMVDTYTYGEVHRVSPEAPVPILQAQNTEHRLGGAANVALNIQALGAHPILCTLAGADPEADLLVGLLEQQRISAAQVVKSDERVTTVKHRVLSGSQHLLRIDRETERSLTAAERSSLTAFIEPLMSEVDLILLQDYDKGCLSNELIQWIIRAAQECSVPVVVDPKKKNFLTYQGVSLFKPNLSEMKTGLGFEALSLDESSLADAAALLSGKMQFDQLLLTLSGEGVYYYSDAVSGKLPAHLRSIADVSGAGDTVISIAGLCCALNLPLLFTAELANLGGGIVCEYPGVMPIDPIRLLGEAQSNELLLAQLK